MQTPVKCVYLRPRVSKNASRVRSKSAYQANCPCCHCCASWKDSSNPRKTSTWNVKPSTSTKKSCPIPAAVQIAYDGGDRKQQQRQQQSTRTELPNQH
eukprot:5661662-Pleurochrysis_carterae.AAC.2